MKIYEIHDLSDTNAIDILKQGLREVRDGNIIKNYHPDYSSENSNIFYILANGRYHRDHGKYFVIVDDYDKYVCSAGWNRYDLDHTVALLLTRMYVTPIHRFRYIIGNTVLPQMIQEAINYDKLWITANDYNRSIYRYFERANLNKRTVLFNDWPDVYRRFKPIGQQLIYYTPQWIAEYDKQNANN
jgi:hypothetical protein